MYLMTGGWVLKLNLCMAPCFLFPRIYSFLHSIAKGVLDIYGQPSPVLLPCCGHCCSEKLLFSLKACKRAALYPASEVTVWVFV